MPIVLFVVTEDWYFISHRLPLARAARGAGYRIAVAGRFGPSADRLRAEGFDLHPIRFRRRGLPVVDDLIAVAQLRLLYRRLLPDVIHHVALKPVLLGTMAAGWGSRFAVVNAVAGLGRLGGRPDGAGRSPGLLLRALRFVARRPRTITIVQHDTDRRRVASGRTEDSVRLLPGVGVDLEEFACHPEVPGIPVIAFAGRLIRAKGVEQFVAAARDLRRQRIPARFALLGAPDEGSPDAVGRDLLSRWEAEQLVEIWGWREDMPEALRTVHVVCLPSVYGEGIPKILLEAASVGRAVVTTDWPGCRDAVLPDVTGLVVPPGDLDALAGALRRLVLEPDLRREFGAAGRLHVEASFDERRVSAATVAIYDVLSGRTPTAAGASGGSRSSED